MKKKCALGILVSGSGTNLQALLDASDDPSYPAEVKLVLSNVPAAFALERARKKNIPAVVVEHGKFASREAFEKELVENLEKAKIDLVVLAGFMRVLSPSFVRRYAGRILNIHPALLPAFPGLHAIQKAWDSGVKITGVTVHFVDEGTDTGPIVLQETVTIEKEDDLKSLEEKIHAVEHKLYPKAVRLFAEGKLGDAS